VGDHHEGLGVRRRHRVLPLRAVTAAGRLPRALAAAGASAGSAADVDLRRIMTNNAFTVRQYQSDSYVDHVTLFKFRTCLNMR